MTSNNEWYTPLPIVRACRQLLGGIDVDPATTALVNHTRVHAAEYYDQAKDGLRQHWVGRVLLNPPGGRDGRVPAVVTWWAKLLEEYWTGRCKAAVFISFNFEAIRHTAAHSLCRQVGVLEFPTFIPHRRIEFDRLVEDGPLMGQFCPGGSPRYANAITYLGDQLAEHLEDECPFAEHGVSGTWYSSTVL